MVVFAFSIQDQVEKYGAYVGLAAFLGLAVLTVLYFAQARELKRLRDWAGRAPERALEVEAQAMANAEAARSQPAPAPERSGTVGPAQPVAPQPAAAPSGNGRPAGKPGPIPIGPRPAVAVAAAAARAQGTAVAEPPPSAEDAVAEVEEPAEVAAVPATDGGGPADPPADITSQETALHDTLGEDEDEDAPATSEPQEEPEPASSGNGAAAEPVIPRATPRPQPRPAASPEPAAPAAPLRASAPSRPAPPRRAPVAPARAGDSSRAAKLTGITVGAIVAVAALVFAATQIFGGDEPTPAPNVTQEPTSSADAGTSGGTGEDTSAAEARPETVVAILNGTPTQGLAKSAGDKLLAEGYSDEAGMVRTGNNSDQQLQDSKVLFAPGKRRQARDVASILGISARPEAVDESTLAVANGVGGGGDSADVVAVLGLDQAP